MYIAEVHFKDVHRVFHSASACPCINLGQILSLASLVLAPADQRNDIGYNAMQVNYEPLTKSVDPEDVLGSMFSCKLISFEEKERISSVQDERGKRRACQKMLDTLLKSWKRGYYERFIQVLKDCNYEECAAQLQSNYYVHVHVHVFVYMHCIMSSAKTPHCSSWPYFVCSVIVCHLLFLSLTSSTFLHRVLVLAYACIFFNTPCRVL